MSRFKATLVAHLWIVAIVCATLSAGAAASGFKVYRYVQHDPRFCNACHLMDDAYGSWTRSEHSRIECHACHQASLVGNMKRLAETILGSTKSVGKHEPIDTTLCLSCHESKGGEKWRKVLATTGHSVHVTKNAARCIDCHAQTLHHFMPPLDICTRCHQDVRIHEAKMAGVECLDCHNYLADASQRTDLGPRALECRRCHGESRPKLATRTSSASGSWAQNIFPGPIVASTSMHGGLECEGCHNPHQSDIESRRSGRACATCHRAEKEELVSAAVEQHADCKSCHQPHGRHHDGQKRCAECHAHEAKVQHPVKAHRAEMQAVTCESCHLPHSLVVNDAGCERCHKKQSTVVSAKKEGHAHRCVDCHGVHNGPSQAIACKRCHESQEESVLAAPAKDHRACATCHSTHGQTLEEARSRCASCHEAKAQLVGKGHDKACKTCHAEHGPARATKDTCLACHSDVALKHPGAEAKRLACMSCHEVHAPTRTLAERDVACKRCHPGMEDRSPAPASVDEHRRCASCHDGHDVTSKKSCGACHAKELEMSSHTAHPLCESCHEAHPERRLLSSAAKLTQESARRLITKETCAKCHAKVVKSIVAHPSAPAAHQDCKSCHLPHTNGALACATCHTSIASKGLHRVLKHRDCPACHATHVDERATRAACLSCHEDRGQHYADSRRCASCHPF
jgi:hypothetical protein